MLTLAAYGGANGRVTLPMFTLVASGVDQPVNYSGPLELPMLTLSAHGGGHARLRLPMLTMAGAGTVWGVGRAALSLPALTLEASGKTGAIGRADLKLPMIRLTGQFGGGGAMTLPMLTMTGSGTVGRVGKAALTLPMLTLLASGTQGNVGRASLTLPMFRMMPSGIATLQIPMFRLVATGGPVVTPAFEAYSINLQTAEKGVLVYPVTRYTNYPFRQIVRFEDDYFGVAADGLYLLGGTTDHATPDPLPIPWAWKTCITDFDVPEKKTIVSAYFGGRLGPEEEVSLYAGDQDQRAYTYKTPAEPVLRNYRQKFGKGLKDRYYAIGASGEDEFEIDSIDFEIAKMTRRV